MTLPAERHGELSRLAALALTRARGPEVVEGQPQPGVLPARGQADPPGQGAPVVSRRSSRSKRKAASSPSKKSLSTVPCPRRRLPCPEAKRVAKVPPAASEARPYSREPPSSRPLSPGFRLETSCTTPPTAPLP